MAAALDRRDPRARRRASGSRPTGVCICGAGATGSIPSSSPRTPISAGLPRWRPRARRRCGAGAHVDDVAFFDLYSCFPSSLHFACDALGIEPTDRRGLTVTGGLAYHGGPASGYLTHSIAAMVERLRGAGRRRARAGQRRRHAHDQARLRRVLDPPRCRATSGSGAEPEVVPVVAAHEGEATVAAYSVVHDRDGTAVRALLVCDLPDGSRTYATSSDPRSVSRPRPMSSSAPGFAFAHSGGRTAGGRATCMVNHASPSARRD